MKRFLSLLVLVLMILSCVSHAQVKDVACVSVIDLDLAARLFAEAGAIWDADGGALWGVLLHTNLIIACGLTRDAAANRPFCDNPTRLTAGGRAVYTGTLPAGITTGNTMVQFRGQNWGMITWAQIVNTDFCEAESMRVLLHEGFHAVQQRLHGHTGGVRINSDSERAQNSCILEVSALAAAWHSMGEARLTAINDALYVRNARRLAYGMAFYENALEIGEGLVTYTADLKLLLSREEIGCAVASWAFDMMNMEVFSENAVAGIWGYWSGALYALLLDELCAGWRTESIDLYTDLGQLLQEAAGIADIVPPSGLERYGYAEIAAAARIRMADFEARTDIALEALARPWIQLPVVRGYGRQYMRMLLVPECRNPTVQPRLSIVTSGIIICQWGRLLLEDGHALIDPDRFYRLSAPGFEIAENRVYGDGWALELNSGWKIHPSMLQPGNYTIKNIFD